MVIVDLYRFTDKETSQVKWEGVYPRRSEKEFAELPNKLPQYKIEIIKDATVPSYLLENCYPCVSFTDIKRIISQEVHDRFTKWMAGQTMPLVENFEYDLAYEDDWERFICGGKVVD